MAFDQIDNGWAVGRYQGKCGVIFDTFAIAVAEQVDARCALVDFGKTESTQARNQLTRADVVKKCRM